MPAKGKDLSKDPASAAAVKEALKMLGSSEITAEAVQKMPVLRRKALSASLGKIRAAYKDHDITRAFNEAGSYEARRQVMARYISDAKDGKLTVTSTKTMESEKKGTAT